jgi:hypothetical protein
MENIGSGNCVSKLEINFRQRDPGELWYGDKKTSYGFSNGPCNLQCEELQLCMQMHITCVNGKTVETNTFPLRRICGGCTTIDGLPALFKEYEGIQSLIVNGNNKILPLPPWVMESLCQTAFSTPLLETIEFQNMTTPEEFLGHLSLLKPFNVHFKNVILQGLSFNTIRETLPKSSFDQGTSCMPSFHFDPWDN